MLLKKLTVQGYKTFANKTEFIFDAGVTSIVGPNGSGKSNVADAIRWVLGEQSYGELRGKRTTDMIFAGSPSRPRAGMANAILTLDNSEGWLPIDYAEVEIGRRAYRTGENEYYINGSRVRLRDVRELLATSGLAQRTYTMIGQGMIDRALSLKSAERRALFEEAAGISHYKARRAETLRRLNETQRNIERVQDVLAEIEPRLRTLKRQAKRAESYEQIKSDLQALLRTWYGYQWAAAKSNLRTAKERAQATEKTWKASRRKLLFLQEQIDQSRQRLTHYNTQLNAKSAARDSIREQVEHARRQVAILTERQTLVSRQLLEIDQELPDLEQQLTLAQSELTHSTDALGEVQNQLAQARSELAVFEKSYQTQQATIETQRKKVQQFDLALQAVQRKTSQAEGQLAQLRERLAERMAEGEDSAENTATQAD
ncbi:MAG TPA: chromosome segregation protein SMC, partial [Anaerolineae bacterium]|nr:chromosome segregation protein SMC [Anaerolineae bacterium]